MASQAASQAAQAGVGPPAASQPFTEIAEPSEAATLPSGPVLQGRVGGLRSAVIHIVPGEDHTVHSSEGGNEHLTYGLACTQGHRTGMEDAHSVELDLDPETGTALFGVFDGHGGRQVADLCAANVVDAVRSSPAYQRGDVGEGLREAFFELDNRALACAEAHLAGATATVALVRGDRLYVAGVGDSRCVLSHAGTAQILTNDHKPDDPKERARIQNAGGFVVWGRVNANLNISRALGDASFKQDKNLSASEQQVSPDPDVRCVTLTRHDTFMVLACDGLWNALPEQQVVAYVQRRLNLRHTLGAVAEGLVAEAMQPQRCAHDNVTVVVVQVKQPSVVALRWRVLNVMRTAGRMRRSRSIVAYCTLTISLLPFMPHLQFNDAVQASQMAIGTGAVDSTSSADAAAATASPPHV